MEDVMGVPLLFSPLFDLLGVFPTGYDLVLNQRDPLILEWSQLIR